MNSRVGKWIFWVFLLFPLLGWSDSALAPLRQAIDQSLGTPDKSPNLVTESILLAALALLPFLVMLFTSFLKMIVVMSLLKNAVGTAQIPPNQVTNGIALILTLYIMAPTGIEMYEKAKIVVEAKEIQKRIFEGSYSKREALDLYGESPIFEELLEKNLQEPFNYLMEIVNQTKEPLRTFLSRNTLSAHLSHFHKLALKNFPEKFHSELNHDHFLILLPSYITSQLQLGFEIGVLIYLPFFIIDLVTSNILLAMGMMMLSPMTISLPLKLLLLVSIDGWTLLVRGLAYTFY